MDGTKIRRRGPGLDLWPGAARVWQRGDVFGLTLALLFAVVVNLSVSVSWLWTDLVSPGVQQLLGASVCGLCLLGWLDARRIRRIWEESTQLDPQLDLFLAARAEYLRGERVVASETLRRLLQQRSDDVESRLLLATLCRRESQFAEAKEQLRRLQRWRGAGRWNMEIRREWELLAQAECGDEAVRPRRRWEFATTKPPASKMPAKGPTVAADLTPLAVAGASRYGSPRETAGGGIEVAKSGVGGNNSGAAAGSGRPEVAPDLPSARTADRRLAYDSHGEQGDGTPNAERDPRKDRAA